MYYVMHIILRVLHVNGMIITLYINIQEHDDLVDENESFLNLQDFQCKFNDIRFPYISWSGLHKSIILSLHNHPLTPLPTDNYPRSFTFFLKQAIYIHSHLYPPKKLLKVMSTKYYVYIRWKIFDFSINQHEDFWFHVSVNGKRYASYIFLILKVPNDDSCQSYLTTF